MNNESYGIIMNRLGRLILSVNLDITQNVYKNQSSSSILATLI